MTILILDAVLVRDTRMADTAQAFRMPPIACLRHEVWPQLRPFVAVAVRNWLAIMWKIVLVVEFLGCSNGLVGFRNLTDVSLFLPAPECAHISSDPGDRAGQGA